MQMKNKQIRKVLAALAVSGINRALDLVKDYSGEDTPMGEPLALAFLAAIQEGQRGTFYRSGHYNDEMPERGGAFSLQWLYGAHESHFEGAEIWEFPRSSVGDYHGSLEAEGNRRYIEREFPKTVLNLFGGFGARSAAFYIGDICPRLIELVIQVDSYPILSESDDEKAKQEAQDSAWESFGYSDFKRELIEQFPDLEEKIDEAKADTLYNYFSQLQEATQTEWQNESGDQVAIRFSELMTAADESELFALLEVAENEVIEAAQDFAPTLDSNGNPYN